MSTNDRPTPETDAELDEHGRYLHGEVLDGTRSEIMYVRAEFAVKLEQQRDALAEALRRIACYPATRSDEISIETARNLARDALAALERGDGKEAAGGVQHDGCNYLAPVGHVCNKCGQVVRAAKDRA